MYRALWQDGCSAKHGRAHHTHISPSHTQKRREKEDEHRQIESPNARAHGRHSRAAPAVPGTPSPQGKRRSRSRCSHPRVPTLLGRLLPDDPHPTCRSSWAGRAPSGCAASREHVRGSHKQSCSCTSGTWSSSLSFKFFRGSYFSKVKF